MPLLHVTIALDHVCCNFHQTFPKHPLSAADGIKLQGNYFSSNPTLCYIALISGFYCPAIFTYLTFDDSSQAVEGRGRFN